MRSRLALPVRIAAVPLAAAALLAAPFAAAEPASGTVSLPSRAGPLSIGVSNAYLVTGPDAVSGKTVRQLIFASSDVGAKIRACATMSCASGVLAEGMTVDFDAGPRLNYWVVGNGQKVQHSGTAKPEETAKLTADTAQRLAGTLAFDQTASGGAKVDVKFDATAVKSFAK